MDDGTRLALPVVPRGTADPRSEEVSITPESGSASAGLGGTVQTYRYSHILVPLDGTPFSEVALRPAAALAKRTNASVLVATVLGSRPPATVTVEPVALPKPDPVKGVTETETYLREVTERIRSEWDVPVSSELLTDSPPAATLARHADLVGADLIVAATHSRNLIVRALLGSTAADLLRAARCPTLLVPSRDPAPSDGTAPMQGPVEVVVATLDPHTGHEITALGHALSWARLWDARLLVVQVSTTPAPSTAGPGSAGPIPVAPSPAFGEAKRKLIGKRLDGLVADLRERGIDAHGVVLRGPRAADAVVDFVESHGADLVVSGRHERSLLERVWLGSVSDRLGRRIRSAGILVCPLHERDRAKGEGSTAKRGV